MTLRQYSQTIPRELVHKRSVAEVLVTSVAESPSGWTVYAQLPRQHSFYTDLTGGQARYHDPFFVLEAIRQSGTAVAHLFHEAPLSARFLVRSYSLAIHDLVLFEIGTEPLDLEIHVTPERVLRRDPQGPATGLEITVIVSGENAPALTFASSFSWLSLDRWAKLRDGASLVPPSRPPRAIPGMVCRANWNNVVIGEPVLSGDRPLSASAPIVVDTGHATMFDHPLDHLPGGLILEACRQLSLAALTPHHPTAIGPVVWTHCEFYAFVELNVESTVQIRQDEDEELLLHGQVVQSGATRAKVTIRFSAFDSPHDDQRPVLPRKATPA